MEENWGDIRMDKRFWFVSDLNLGQDNCSDIEQCWNDVVFDEDIVFLLGNIAAVNKAYWFSEIQRMPGRKVLFLGTQETNRPQWYHKFDFEEVVPFNQTRTLQSSIGKVMLSHLPVYESVQATNDSKFLGLIKKFNHEFDMSSCILNIHGHTNGLGNERNNTIDVSHAVVQGNMPNLAQVLQTVKDKNNN